MSTEVYDSDVYEDGQQFKDDQKLHVRFYKQPIKMEAASIAEGRPIFQDFDYIHIMIPGQRDDLKTEVTEHYIRRFRRQWENYQARNADVTIGTPLAEVPWLTQSQVLEFTAVNIRTVENLRDLPDVLGQRFMGIHELKARAARFLEAAKGEAPILKLEAENQRLKETIGAQADQLAAMDVAIKELQAAKKPVTAGK